MKVYAVSEDDVVYFDSIVECRNWIKSKGFRNENPPEVWNVYRVGEYDSDGDAYALESYDIRDYASYIVDGGRYRKFATTSMADARRIARREANSSGVRVPIYAIGEYFYPPHSVLEFVEPKGNESRPVQRKGTRR